MFRGLLGREGSRKGLKWTGRRIWMRPLSVVLISVVLASLTLQVEAQPPVRVTGVLNGYFLSPDGHLKVYEIPFAFPEKPTPDNLPKRLYPLWAGYSLQARFFAPKPVQSVWLLSGVGRLIWRRHYPQGVTEETIPYQPEGWVSLKGQDGLSIKLVIRFIDGDEVLLYPHFPVHFERILPLKVDWLDFVRLAEVAHLLASKGKEIWEGFRIEEVPFLLEGDEGQWVLINHPKPPKRFKRYRGPLPKVPLELKVYWGEGIGKLGEEGLGGWVQKVNGIWTAVLRYFPNWWALSRCSLPNYPAFRQPDALQRLEVMIHEAFHVWWLQRTKKPREEGRSQKSLVIEMVEWECLARALEATEEREKRQWIKAFLEMREKRRRREGANRAQILFERWQETTEGVATYVGMVAMNVVKRNYEPTPEIEWDEEFIGYKYGAPLDEEMIASWVRQGGGRLDLPHVMGLAQALLLSRWEEKWQKEVMRGKRLEELLEERVRGVILPANFMSGVKVTKSLWEAVERAQGNLREAKPPSPSIPLWLYLPPEVVELISQTEKNLGNPLPLGLRFFLSGITILIEPPVWIRVEESRRRVGILWDVSKQLMLLYRPDGTVTMQGGGLEVRGKLRVSWNLDGVHVHFGDKSRGTKEGASLMARKKAWYAIVLPMALLAAIASRDTKALQGQETIAVEETITGVFLNAATSQLELVTLPIPSSEEDYYFVDEEEYLLRATFTPSWDPANPTMQDFIVLVSVTYFFDGPSPRLNWFSLSPAEVTIGGKPYKGRVVVDELGNVFGELLNEKGEVVVRVPIKKVPPPGELLVKVYLVTENENDPHKPTITPFADVVVEAYYWDSKENRWKFKAKVKADSNGEALFPELAPGQYRLKGFKRLPIPACPQVVEEVTVMEKVRNITSMYFYTHKPIKGRVMEQTSSGEVPLANAKAYLCKNDQQLSGPWTTDSDGYFFIPPFEIDAVLAQYGSGTYTVKVVPPGRSMMKPEPLEASKSVSLTKCERKEPLDSCPRALTVDVGTFVFTYKPAYPGPGGGG